MRRHQALFDQRSSGAAGGRGWSRFGRSPDVMRAYRGFLRQASVQPRLAGAERSGAAMVFVLILLLVISMFTASLLRTTIAQYRQRLRDEIRAQTVRLAEAGLARAQRQAQQNTGYAGEVWQISADDLGTGHAAAVHIKVVTDAVPRDRKFAVTAEYPVDNPLVTRLTLDTIVGDKGE